ncbi:hypothetical protein HNY73_004982 [Argiope bruennichi]|uniref:Uncharacterized protein n=1 Tax=Argiope bruennichi TaxID=94029 RepID=A0A8T0FVC4_ARGBR|nr:hypothetical protein HNY73_004982 [Argiope bruennichi]
MSGFASKSVKYYTDDNGGVPKTRRLRTKRNEATGNRAESGCENGRGDARRKFGNSRKYWPEITCRRDGKSWLNFFGANSRCTRRNF